MPRKAKITPIQPTPIVPQLPPAPEPPNPVVLALQEQILGLVNQRSMCMQDLANAKSAHVRAQESIAAVESEVQYRLQLIAQLQGKPAQLNVGLDSRAFASIETTMPFPSGLQAGVGSIPPRRVPMAGVVGEVRSEDAEDVRRSI